MTKYLSSGATDDDDKERRLQANLFIANIVHSKKNVSLEYIKINIAYNMRKTTTAIQRTLTELWHLIFGYDNF